MCHCFEIRTKLIDIILNYCDCKENEKWGMNERKMEFLMGVEHSVEL